MSDKYLRIENVSKSYARGKRDHAMCCMTFPWMCGAASSSR